VTRGPGTVAPSAGERIVFAPDAVGAAALGRGEGDRSAGAEELGGAEDLGGEVAGAGSGAAST